MTVGFEVIKLIVEVVEADSTSVVITVGTPFVVVAPVEKVEPGEIPKLKPSKFELRHTISDPKLSDH